MILASFDVGIKFMSFCIFQVSPETGLKIIDWKIINLFGSVENPLKTCTFEFPATKKNRQRYVEKKQCMKKTLIVYVKNTR